MLYNSYSFILFFPIALVMYFLTPKHIRYVSLLVISYVFYMCWDPRFIVLMLYLTALTYTSGSLIDRVRRRTEDDTRARTTQKCILAATVVLGLAPLLVLKYSNFVITTVNSVLMRLGVERAFALRNFLLPIGISFVTLQALTYPIDVYRNEVKVEKNYLKYSLFVSFFTNIAAGPIERAKNMLPQIDRSTTFDVDRFWHGLMVMLWGYFLKLVLADRVTIFVDTVYGNPDTYGGWFVIIATLLYGVQIYCDFAGYSTIALGAAEILGFDIIQNFKAPYLSRSCSEFWRKWHISLSSWFRDYLYIPLGGNRKGTLRKYLNIMIVFLVSGLWHGAQWTFVIWGGLNGAYQVIGSILKPIRTKCTGKLKLHPDSGGFQIVQMVLTYLFIDFAWLFFRAESFTAAKTLIRSAFTAANYWILFDDSLYTCGIDEKSFHLMLLAIAVLLIVDLFNRNQIQISRVILAQDAPIRWIVISFAIVFILTFGIWGPGYQAANFIYSGF